MKVKTKRIICEVIGAGALFYAFGVVGGMSGGAVGIGKGVSHIIQAFIVWYAAWYKAGLFR